MAVLAVLLARTATADIAFASCGNAVASGNAAFGIEGPDWIRIV